MTETANLRIITANLQANLLHSEELDETTCAVKPVVAVVAGVLNGEPMPLRHPVDENGQYLNSQQPGGHSVRCGGRRCAGYPVTSARLD